MADGVTKAISIAKRVAKQVPKVLAVSLPAMSIGQNIIEAHALHPTDNITAFREFAQRYSGVMSDGQFHSEKFMLGTGRLLLAGLTGWALKQLT